MKKLFLAFILLLGSELLFPGPTSLILEGYNALERTDDSFDEAEWVKKSFDFFAICSYQGFWGELLFADYGISLDFPALLPIQLSYKWLSLSYTLNMDPEGNIVENNDISKNVNISTFMQLNPIDIALHYYKMQAFHTPGITVASGIERSDAAITQYSADLYYSFLTEQSVLFSSYGDIMEEHKNPKQTAVLFSLFTMFSPELYGIDGASAILPPGYQDKLGKYGDFRSLKIYSFSPALGSAIKINPDDDLHCKLAFKYGMGYSYYAIELDNASRKKQSGISNFFDLEVVPLGLDIGHLFFEILFSLRYQQYWLDDEKITRRRMGSGVIAGIRF